MEQTKKRDHKIFITDIAIDKVPYVEVAELSKATCELIQKEHQEILRVAQQKNNSNEVLSILSLNTKIKSQILGNEISVDPSNSTEAMSLFHSSRRNELALLHNRPSTNNFSLADIDTFIRNGQIKLISVVSNQGEVYILCKKTDYNYSKVREFLLDLLAKYDDNNSKILASFLKNCGKAGIIYVHS